MEEGQADAGGLDRETRALGFNLGPPASCRHLSPRRKLRFLDGFALACGLRNSLCRAPGDEMMRVLRAGEVLAVRGWGGEGTIHGVGRVEFVG